MAKPASPAAQPAAALRIGLAGLGTVGRAVVELIGHHGPRLEGRAGRALELAAVSARRADRNRGALLAQVPFEPDPVALARRDDVDIVVELIGGDDGPALALAEAALAAGKPLVTANKALLAHHGARLAALAEAAGVALRFEGAVAGGVPVVKGLREGAAASALSRVAGILNGTSNLILSRMESEQRDFHEVLVEAQAAGLAEADPSFDVDGIDTAHKLALLAAVAFGALPNPAAIPTAGIRGVRLADIVDAERWGFRVRLIGSAERVGDGLRLSVGPCLVPAGHLLASVTGALNAVIAEGEPVGRLAFVGPGAGGGPTAAAVVADLVDIARHLGAGGHRAPFAPVFSEAGTTLRPMPAAAPASDVARFWLRLEVEDRAGVLARLAATLADRGVSIERLFQPPHAKGPARVLLITHEAPAAAVADAARALEALDAVAGPLLVMPLFPPEG